MPNIVDLSRGGGADPRAVIALVAFSKKARAMLSIRLAEIGLQIGEEDILTALQSGRTTSIQEVSDALYVRTHTVSKIVDGLVVKGLISRLAGPLIAISDTGADMVPRIEFAKSRMSRDLQRVIGAARLERLTKDLEDLNEGVRLPIKL
jgi:DNA-binding MarR family transcriptional regulator